MAENELAFALRDPHPVSPGHTLIVAKRLIATWFDATREEQSAIMRLIDEVKATLDRELTPAGYNIGFDAGASAGQIVMHLHVHIIPRFRGDAAGAHGGLRHVIPRAAEHAIAPSSTPPATVQKSAVGSRTVEPGGTDAKRTRALPSPSARVSTSRQASLAAAEGFTCDVTWNQRDPILRFPPERTQASHGEVEARLPDGALYHFRLAGQFVSFARVSGSLTNALPDLLRRWFGPSAGRPGTTYQVRFYAGPEGLCVGPFGSGEVSLAPPAGVMLFDHELESTFGVHPLSRRSGRYGGHLFVFVDREGMLPTPHTVRDLTVQRRPGETAYVLAKHGESYRCLGVGRWDEAAQLWSIPDADFASFRAWGDGGEPARRLPAGVAERAQAVVDVVLARAEATREVCHSDGRRARIVGAAPRGGLRIVGVDGAFSERTISLADLAWVLAASDDVALHGGVLDDLRIHHLRYLEGTPKGSTRWLDSGWAMAIVRSAT